MKWCVPALLICENAYRLEKNIDHVYLNNTQNHGNLKMENVQKIINSLDLFSDGKITSEGRFNTLAFMKDYLEDRNNIYKEQFLEYRRLIALSCADKIDIFLNLIEVIWFVFQLTYGHI